MHPPPAESELDFLIGLEIEAVTLGPWSTQFLFADGGRIAVEGAIEHVNTAGVSHWHQNADEQDRGPVFFREFIQQTIIRIKSTPDRLTLFLNGGAELRILAEIGPYECAQIYHPDGRPMPMVF